MSENITKNPSVPSQIVGKATFPKFISNLGIIPTSYKDSMNYYECLAWFCKFLKEQVIPTVNENGEAVEELQCLYVELNSYVTNYFNNLNVQEEINNKLDAMTEAGTLQEIITHYIQATALWIFDTVADMQSATNLINGSFAKTLGYYSLNDGGGATYKIKSTSTSYYETINENLVAELVNDEEFIDIKKIGCQVNTDITTKLNNIFNYYHYILISDGTFEISQVHIPSNSVIKGTKNSLLKVINNYAINSSTNYYILENLYENNVTYDSLNINGNSENNTQFNLCDLITCIGNNSKVINCKLFNSIDSAIMFSKVINGECSNNYIDTTRDCGIYVNSGTLGELKNDIISNNIIKNTGASAIACKRYSSDLLISNNMLYDCNFGITMEQASSSTDFSTEIPIINNLINNCLIGINIRGGYNHNVSNNTLIDCQERSILIDSCINCNISNNNIQNTKTSTTTYKGTVALTVRSSEYPLKDINLIGNNIKSKEECILLYNSLSQDYEGINISNNILNSESGFAIRNTNGILYNSIISNNISSSNNSILIAPVIENCDLFITNNINLKIFAQNYIQPAFLIGSHTDSSNVTQNERRIFNCYRAEAQRNSSRYKKGDIVFSNLVTGVICYIANADGIGSEVLVPLITLT